MDYKNLRARLDEITDLISEMYDIISTEGNVEQKDTKWLTLSDFAREIEYITGLGCKPRRDLIPFLKYQRLLSQIGFITEDALESILKKSVTGAILVSSQYKDILANKYIEWINE